MPPKLAMPPFYNFFRGHVGVWPGSMRTEFEVGIFSPFGAVSI